MNNPVKTYRIEAGESAHHLYQWEHNGQPPYKMTALIPIDVFEYEDRVETYPVNESDEGSTQFKVDVGDVKNGSLKAVKYHNLIGWTRANWLSIKDSISNYQEASE